MTAFFPAPHFADWTFTATVPGWAWWLPTAYVALGALAAPVMAVVWDRGLAHPHGAKVAVRKTLARWQTILFVAIWPVVIVADRLDKRRSRAALEAFRRRMAEEAAAGYPN